MESVSQSRERSFLGEIYVSTYSRSQVRSRTCCLQIPVNANKVSPGFLSDGLQLISNPYRSVPEKKPADASPIVKLHTSISSSEEISPLRPLGPAAGWRSPAGNLLRMLDPFPALRHDSISMHQHSHDGDDRRHRGMPARAERRATAKGTECTGMSPLIFG